MDVKPVKEYNDAKYPNLKSVRENLRRNGIGAKAAVSTAMAVAAALSLTMCTPATTTGTGDETTSAVDETGTFETQLAGDLAVTETTPMVTLSGIIAPEQSVVSNESTTDTAAGTEAKATDECTTATTGDETFLTTAGIVAIEG